MKIGLGLIGLGTVGTGVAKILKNNNAAISKRVGSPVSFVRYCDKFAKARPDLGLKESDITTNYKDLLKDPAVDVVVELIGGYEPARTIILEALKSGKHVVTANKAVISKYWDEIFSAAQQMDRMVYFEAAVGGGIPIVQGLNDGLSANRVKKITGILNGTTNFILTRMAQENLSFDAALKQAQASGFAEADPSFDIEGIDTSHKIAILSSIAFGAWVRIGDVYCEGISKLDLLDVQLAQKYMGYGLKLLGISKELDGKIDVRVHPCFLRSGHPFLSVNDEYNSVSVVGDAVDDVMFYGKGAGQMAAASAVSSDIVFLARQLKAGIAGKLPYVTYDSKRKVQLLGQDKVESKYYLRFTTKDEPGVLAKISGILGKCDVSIASVVQPRLEDHSINRAPNATILITTHCAQEGQVQKAIKEINKLASTKAKTVLIRIED